RAACSCRRPPGCPRSRRRESSCPVRPSRFRLRGPTRPPFEARAFASRFPLCAGASTVLTLTRPASIAEPRRGRPLRSEQSGGVLAATGGCLVGAKNEYPPFVGPSLQHDVLLSIFAPFLTGSGRSFGRARGGVLRIVVREDRDRVSACGQRPMLRLRTARGGAATGIS